MEEARKKKWGSVALIIELLLLSLYDLLYSYFKSQHVKQIIMALKN